jgi:hypothetical protein
MYSGNSKPPYNMPTPSLRQIYMWLMATETVIFQNKYGFTYNWYKIVVFPALSKPTIITLCSEIKSDLIIILVWNIIQYNKHILVG